MRANNFLSNFIRLCITGDIADVSKLKSLPQIYNFVHKEVNRLFPDILAHFLLLLQGLNQVLLYLLQGENCSKTSNPYENSSLALEKSSTSDSR